MQKNVKKAIALLLSAAMTVSFTGTAAGADSLSQCPAADSSGVTSEQSAAQISGTDTPSTIIMDGADTELSGAGQSGETFEEKNVTAKVECPSYQEAYERMIALKDKEAYQEGVLWTNFTPYGKDSPTNETAYWFNGGPVKGARGGVGCAAFVFILSDTAFGTLPARVTDFGQFSYEDIKVGDILRLNNTHFVIVLEKSATGVIVAEGNYNKSVHWGRALSKAEAEAANFIVTRYPEGFTSPDEETADETVQNGTAGSLNWELTKGGTLTISGEGEIPNYGADNRPGWETDGYPSVKAINIGKGITKIGDYAFYQSTAMNVLIADTVTEIGNQAFQESKLLGVTIPGKTVSIGDDAFRSCENLTSVSVSEGLQTIGQRAFQACQSLQYIDFPKTIRSVGAGAFVSCQNMVSVRFAPGTDDVTMGDNTFSQCWRLSVVALPEKLTAISNGMFDSCQALTELYIPASVEKLGDDPTGSPFIGAKVLWTIYFGGTQSEWDSMVNTKPVIQANFTQAGTKVECNAEYKNPFAADPDDPGDLVTDEDNPCKDGHTGVADENGNCTVCGKPFDESEKPGETEPDAHKHAWGTEWAKNETHHWHDCGATDCPITDQAEKDGYAEHDYGSWTVDVNAAAYTDGSRHRDCSVCGYRQSERIPATGGSSSGGSSGDSWGSGGSSGGYWGSGSSSSGSSGGSSAGSAGTTAPDTATPDPAPGEPDPVPGTPDPAPDTDNPTAPDTTVSAPDNTVVTNASENADGTFTNPSGTVLTNSIVETQDGAKYITDDAGKKITGTVVTASDGTMYCTKGDGKIAQNQSITLSGKKYFAKEDGAVAKGEFCETPYGNTVYAKADGTLATGMTVTAGGKKYYAKTSGAIAKKGLFTTEKGNTVYARADGTLAVNKIVSVNDRKYYAKASGAIAKNTFTTIAKGIKVYSDADGVIVVNKIFKVKGKRYFAKKNGRIAVKTWVTVGSRKYYCNADGQITKTKAAV